MDAMNSKLFDLLSMLLSYLARFDYFLFELTPDFWFDNMPQQEHWLVLIAAGGFIVAAFMGSLNRVSASEVLGTDIDKKISSIDKDELPERIEKLLSQFPSKKTMAVLASTAILYFVFFKAVQGFYFSFIEFIVTLLFGGLVGKRIGFKASFLFVIAVFILSAGIQEFGGEMYELHVYLPAGFLLMLFFGLVWARIMTTREKGSYEKALVFACKGYFHLKDWKQLEKSIKKARAAGGESEEQTWMEANMAVNRKQVDKAIDLLEKLPLKMKYDKLLLKLYAGKNDFDAIRTRAEVYDDAKAAIKLVESLPKSDERNRVLIPLLVKIDNWGKIGNLVSSMRLKVALEVIEGLPKTKSRDKQLIKLLALAGRHDDIIELAGGYGLKEGEKLIFSSVPEKKGRDQILALFLAQNGQYDRVREFIDSFGVSVLAKLPPGEETDVLHCEVWVREGSLSDLTAYFKGRPPEDAVQALEKVAAGLDRDRMLARYLFDLAEYGQAASCLEPYFKDKKLAITDLDILAECYQETGNPEKALSAAEGALQLEPENENLLKKLCRAAVDSGLKSSFLAELDPAFIGRLSADSLWLLVEYFNSVDQPAQAMETARRSVDSYKDKRAAAYLAPLLEQEGNLAEAAELYAIVGRAADFAQAMCRFGLGEFEKSAELFEQIDLTDRNRASVMYHLGFSHYRNNRFQDAIDAFQKMGPESETPEIRLDLAVFHSLAAREAMTGGRYEQAIDLLEKGLEIIPQDAEKEIEALKNTAAQCYYRQAFTRLFDPEMKPDEILELADQAKKYRSGKWKELEMIRGLALLQGQDLEKALQMFSIMDKRYPDDRAVQFHKSLSAAMAGLDDMAAKGLKKIVSDNHEDDYSARARLLLGSIAMRAENWDEAESYLREAVGKE